MTKPKNAPQELEDILENMIENTVMLLTNDLPSLLDQERVAEIRRVHKDEILKNLPEALAQIQALIDKAYDKGFGEGSAHIQKIYENALIKKGKP